MECYAPVLLRNDKRKYGEYYYHKVGCGKCIPCVKKRKAGWIFRLKNELKVSSHASFLTLTYAPEHLVYGEFLATLDRKAFPSFVKRLRKKISEIDELNDVRIKYYAVGEYGDITLRPHYHAIVFNLPAVFQDEKVLSEIWKLGFVKCDPVTDGALAYVVGYVDKKLLQEKKLEGVEPEFSLMSKGLGKNYLSEARVKFYKKKEIPFLVDAGGQKHTMPRYYKDKIYDDQAKERVANKAKEFIENQEEIPAKDYFEAIENEIQLFRKKAITKRKTI